MPTPERIIVKGLKMTKLCSVCRNVFPPGYPSKICYVPLEVGKPQTCSGTIIEVNCLLCLDTAKVTVLGVEQACSRGCGNGKVS